MTIEMACAQQDDAADDKVCTTVEDYHYMYAGWRHRQI